MLRYLIVFIGAGIGGVFRHVVNLIALRVGGPNLPQGTLIVNVVGSIAIGMLAGYFALRVQVSRDMQLFLTTGILGGFTTFSAFALEAALLWERGQFGAFAAFVVASVGLSIFGVFAGLALVR